MEDKETTKNITNKRKLKKDTEKAIFFLRHNNDIDHITPVLYKWLSTEDIPTDIIIISERKYLHDYRIDFLRKYKNVRISYLNNKFRKWSLTYFFNIFYAKYTTESDKIIKQNRFIRKITDKITNEIARKIFANTKKGIVVFDWTKTYFVQRMTQIAKQRGFTSVSLPHGDWPYESQLMNNDELNYACLTSLKDLDIFDFVVVPNNICYPRYERCLSKEKIKVLGCPRYSDEWMKIIPDLTPSYDIPNSNDKLKIIFFLRNACYPIFWEEVVRSIKLILQFPGVYLIIKHHPRNKNARTLTKKLLKIYPEVKQNINKNLKFIYENVNSASLLKWADLIVDFGTSISFGAVKEGKSVLMPEYMYANYSTIAHYIKSSELKCRDELYDMIEKFVENKNLKLYGKDERERFIKEVINVPDKNVLERYTKFLKKCLNE